MKRILTAVITAIEAGAVALAGLVLVAIPGILLWIVTFQLASEPAEVAAAISAVWLLGHGVPIGFALDPQAALGLGLTPEALQFTLSLAPLGLVLVSTGAGARIGWRLGRRGGSGAVGLPAGAMGFALLALLPVSLAGPLLAAPAWIAVLLPTLFFAVPAAAGFVLRAARDGHEWWHRGVRALHRGSAGLGWHRSADALAALGNALRLATATLALLIALAACSVIVALVGGYVQIIALSQHLQLDPLGAVILFWVQLAFLPIAVIWALAWLTGSGFAIGAGSSVTPFETLLGPVPALPMFGAIPPAWGSWGTLAILLVVLGAFACGAVLARRRGPAGALREAAVVVCAAVLLGLATAGLSTLATGSIGPDRLAVTGPNTWLTAGWAAAEVAVGFALGALAARLDIVRNLGRVTAVAAAGAQRVRGAVPGLGLSPGAHPPAGTAEEDLLVTEDYGSAALADAEHAVSEFGSREFAAREFAAREFETGEYAAAELDPAEFEPAELDPAGLDPAELEFEPLRPIDRLASEYVPGYTVADAPTPSTFSEPSADLTPVDDAALRAPREFEPEPEPELADDPLDAEEELVRAYAWDESAFPGTDPFAGDGDPDPDRKKKASPSTPWWRQFGARKGQQDGAAADSAAKAANTDADAAETELPTVDLGTDPLATPEQLD